MPKTVCIDHGALPPWPLLRHRPRVPRTHAASVFPGLRSVQSGTVCGSLDPTYSPSNLTDVYLILWFSSFPLISPRYPSWRQWVSEASRVFPRLGYYRPLRGAAGLLGPLTPALRVFLILSGCREILRLMKLETLKV